MSIGHGTLRRTDGSVTAPSNSHQQHMWQSQQKQKQLPMKKPTGSTAIKQQAYLTLVRPFLEWCKFTPRDGYTQKVDMVQRRVARYVTNRHWNTSSVSDVLQGSKWRTLPDRRMYARASAYRIDREQVPVVQRIVSLTTSLSKRFVKCFKNYYSNIPICFVAKR